MKFTQTLIATAVLLTTSSIALAAPGDVLDTRSIQIDVQQGAFAKLTGTALTTAHTFQSAQMDGSPLGLGDLGIDSNITGADTCNLSFESLHGYNLKLGNSPTGATLVSYALTLGSTPVVTAVPILTTCQMTAEALTFNSTSPLPAENTIAAGTYSDVVTIKVTSVL